MRVAIFSTRNYERPFLEAANAEHGHELEYFDATLKRATAGLARDVGAVCVFVHDELDAGTLLQLQRQGVKLILLRCAGFNNVDIASADELGLTVLRVPTYSPTAIAEHTLSLLLSLNRKIHRAYARVRENNFSLAGLLGFELRGKTIGIIGTGAIGVSLARLLQGFQLEVLGYDVRESDEFKQLGGRYVEQADLLERSDIISLHAPLTPQTRHLINNDALARMKRGVMLINTSRGPLIDTRAVIEALKSGKIGSLALDVYEEESDIFFHNLSEEVIQDDVFARLLTFPNVLITSHQAFFTREAVESIAATTLQNLSDYAAGEIVPTNRVSAEHVR